MVNIIKEELPIEESLRKKLELICEFAKTTPIIINGNIGKIDKTNLTYIEPHRVIIKNITFQYKEVLGIYIGENETSKYWLGVLNELKEHGIKDILIMCSDNLTGIKEAINAAFPNTVQQRCIVHMIRNSVKYVNYKDLKAFTADLKLIYTSKNEKEGYDKLQEVKEKWEDKYASAFKIWESNWDAICPFFRFSEPIRKIMYTTNTIESLNRQFRKYTKTKSVFPTDLSLLKCLYLSVKNIDKKWDQAYRNWGPYYQNYLLCLIIEYKVL